MKKIIDPTGSNYSVYLLDAADKETVLRQLADQLYQKGFVKESYADALLEREKIYPTGLPTNGVGIAIPHTDSCHVNEEALAVGVLAKPVNFTVMGSETDEVAVELLFMLAIKNPESQLDMLQKLVSECQNEEVLYTLRDHSNIEAMEQIIKRLQI